MPTYARGQIVVEDDENSPLETCERPDAWLCELTLQETARSNWVETVRGFGRLFKQAAGQSSSLVDAAARRSRRWFQGKAAARTAFV